MPSFKENCEWGSSNALKYLWWGSFSKRNFCEWFQRFKSGDFGVEDRHGCGKEKIFEDLAESLGVTQQAILKRLKAIAMIQKEGNWVPYELKPRDVERRFFACGQLLQRQNRKCFLHRIVIDDKKWIQRDNPKCKKSRRMPGYASTSTARPNIHGAKVMLCIWWDQLGVMYYGLLKPSEIITRD